MGGWIDIVIMKRRRRGEEEGRSWREGGSNSHVPASHQMFVCGACETGPFNASTPPQPETSETVAPADMATRADGAHANLLACADGNGQSQVGTQAGGAWRGLSEFDQD